MNQLDVIYDNKSFFYFLMVKNGSFPTMKMDQIIEQINRSPSHSFSILPNKGLTMADPFIICHEGQYYVFYEQINPNRLWKDRIGEQIGEIYYSKISSNLEFSKPELALSTKYHLSFPFLIQDNEKIYMLPEQSKCTGLILYECKTFPNKWTAVCELLKGSFVDSIIFFYEDLYWLFTVESTADSNVKENLYYSSILCSKEWTFHSTINISKKKVSRRGAGNIFMKNGRIYRPVQHNREYYAQGIIMLEITKLSKTNYEERIVGEIGRNIHTLNILDELLIIDSHTKNKLFFESDYESRREANNYINNLISEDDVVFETNCKNDYIWFYSQDISYSFFDKNLSKLFQYKKDQPPTVQTEITLENYYGSFDVVKAYLDDQPEWIETLLKLITEKGKCYFVSDIHHPEHHHVIELISKHGNMVESREIVNGSMKFYLVEKKIIQPQLQEAEVLVIEEEIEAEIAEAEVLVIEQEIEAEVLVIEQEIEQVEKTEAEVAEAELETQIEQVENLKQEQVQKTNKKFFTLEFSVLDNTDSMMEIEIKIINHMNKKIVVTNQIISEKITVP